MSLKLSKAAEADLIDIYLHGAQTFGQVQAERYQDRLDRALLTLVATPKLARERFEISPPVRVHPVQAHIIVYRIEEDSTVHILRIRHQREDWVDNPGGG